MSYSYDEMGRVTAGSQTTDGVTYPFTYTYNLAGGVETTALPSGRSLKQCYDVAGRAKSVTGTKSGEAAHDYISQITYDSGGGMNQAQLGNGKWEDWDYNARKQVTSIKLGATAGASDLLQLTYDYGLFANNGNVLTQAIARPSFSVTQNYGYTDPLNRLSSVTEGTESRTFDYSATGNMWVATASTNFAPGSFTPRTSTWYNANNRLVNTGLGITYDSAGNQTAIGGYTNTFDAENRLASSTINSVTTSYAYDGEGRRVKKGAVVMVYDAFGKLAAEYGGAVTSVGREYLTGDHLGSTRLVTNAAGNPTKCADYLPFGEEIGQGVNGRGTCYGFTDPRQKFTGKERDAETNLDYFGARYFSGAQGRWTGPDLVNVTNDRLFSPSNTLNKYIYGGNNPLKYTDPDGQDITLFYQSGYPTGHIMMAAYNQKTTDFAFLSVGPQTHDGILTNPFEGVPGTSEFKLPQTVDDLRQNFSSLTIQTSPEVAQQAINAIRNGAGTGNWALLGNNCTSSCAKVLKDIGLYPGSNGGLAWTPDKLWANLNLLYGKNRPPAFVRSIMGPTIGGSPLMTPGSQPGTDFGNPRYGMNVFDWVMLQLKAPLKACVTVTDSATGSTSTECH